MKTSRSVSLSSLIPNKPTSTLTPEQVERIKAFRQTFAEVFPGELEEALENFRRDQNPEREILVWEKMAEEYKRQVGGCKSHDKRRDLFHRILQASMEESPLVVEPLRN